MKNKNKLTLEGVDPKIVTNYACEDVDQTLQLRNHLQPIIDKYKLNTPCQLDFEVVKVLASMEYNGVCIDKNELEKIERKVVNGIAEAKATIEKFTKGEVNLASSSQISSFLFEQLHLNPIGGKGKSGHYSVSKNVLTKLVGEHEIISALLDYRALTKVKSTFIKALKATHPKTGRLHTSFNLTVTSTGRLSSSKPNLQNIPSRSVGKQLRAVFVPPTGHVFIGADYSNIELRVAAHLSQDKNMLNSYRTGVDVHSLTASKIFNVDDIEKVSKPQRDVAKTVNFGLLYGMTAQGLSERLSREEDYYSPEQCQQFINDFFELYEGVAKFRDELIERATIKGYAETMIGRRRPLPELQSNDTSKREAGKRKALNTPIQGTAADILKTAMVNIYNRIQNEDLKSKMLLQVHDELLIEVPTGEKELMEKLVKQEMKNAVSLSIPLEVELKVGQTWQEVH
ncbi:DNA polymerase [Christiangramia flava]|uniref:DNA polymerase I n=1 Tax=Christiangramia flava JLT2011 TaxID=1229726 RepID=A0A1L7I3G1_9FLAO|nr:DNA polymerase [Christiangramia flava]APU67744.1 DNA polymerase I [Christiangramia flava JLT2011]OSS40248.1 DNA polymerase I [Christiangramia flava JLT2011]